ncbi:hypothetical protein R1flu_000656 [Riccia fluitans]|uniref:Uncharacterized protein n=1 Tax=Riccia fluitans TaxID=41844 RepID=A0ABD1Y125_9MARC
MLDVISNLDQDGSRRLLVNFVQFSIVARPCSPLSRRNFSKFASFEKCFREGSVPGARVEVFILDPRSLLPSAAYSRSASANGPEQHVSTAVLSVASFLLPLTLPQNARLQFSKAFP